MHFAHTSEGSSATNCGEFSVMNGKHSSTGSCGSEQWKQKLESLFFDLMGKI